jgi:hypothetical protein
MDIEEKKGGRTCRSWLQSFPTDGVHIIRPASDFPHQDATTNIPDSRLHWQGTLVPRFL